ncbi:MAG: hypothetical protein B9S33_16280 [Pedosphaera sp. Tous-C6FEB]|nr:MAG: hypothetical protein B9S33_16280 [Pedosphaera sp. Tous-C6FEB]
MNARDHLFSLYEQWRRLSLAEGDGIQRGDWAEVRRCQNAKQTLQERIVLAIDALKAEQVGLPAEPGETESAIRTVVSRLMELEGHNSRLLAEQRARSEAEQAGATRATQNLRQLNRAYGQSHASGWQNYS